MAHTMLLLLSPRISTLALKRDAADMGEDTTVQRPSTRIFTEKNTCFGLSGVVTDMDI